MVAHTTPYVSLNINNIYAFEVALLCSVTANPLRPTIGDRLNFGCDENMIPALLYLGTCILLVCLGLSNSFPTTFDVNTIVISFSSLSMPYIGIQVIWFIANFFYDNLW